MKKSTAELLMGIKGAARHGETCGIGQTAVSDAAADGIQLTVVDRKKVTTGGVESVECIVRCDLAPECFELAAQTLKDMEAAEAAKLVTAPSEPSPADVPPSSGSTESHETNSSVTDATDAEPAASDAPVSGPDSAAV